MRSGLLLCVALSMAAGCASSRPPPPATPSPSASPEWVRSAASSEEFQFTAGTGDKAAENAKGEAPGVALRVDSATGYDVKHAHLNAASH